MEMNWDLDQRYIFLLEYFVHEAVYAYPLTAVKQPALGFRFLDFPTQMLYSRDSSKLVFKCGKKCRFAMNPAYLRQGLFESPFYVMLVDSNKDNVQILASSAVNISCFAKDNDFLKLAGTKKPIHRNTVILFDKVRNEVGKIDLTLCISRESATPTLPKKIIPEKEAEPAMNYEEEMKELPQKHATPKKVVEDVAIQTKENVGVESNATQTRKVEVKKDKTQKASKSLADIAQQYYCPPAMFFQKN